MTLDHGYAVDADKRCTATTKKQRQCSLPALVGLSKCALHSGLARPKRDSRHGNPQALDAYRRALVQPTAGRGTGRQN